MSLNQKKYDFIIAGSGCAGLSLAMQLMQSKVSFSKVLIIDRAEKKENDRTWCFWSKERNNWYDSIICKKWSSFSFKSKDFSKNYVLEPYQYMMIRGIDFYDYCLKLLKSDSRFEFVLDDILKIKSGDTFASVSTANSEYIANYVFNSAIVYHDKKSHHVNYEQHFKGFMIETEKESFDDTTPVFMDFSVDQYDDCRFVYVIPHSKTKALVEYTGFSPAVIKDEEYDAELNNYIKNHLNISQFKISETEKGVIPMAESDFINPFGKRVINIGTAGGYSKPSTGFTFYFIQRNIRKIIEDLESNHLGLNKPRKNRFLFYDKVLLEVMNKKQVSSSNLFSVLFQRNSIQTVLSFLNEESTLLDEFKIMNSVRDKHFILAAIKKMRPNA